MSLGTLQHMEGCSPVNGYFANTFGNSGVFAYELEVNMQVACSTSHQPAVLQMFKDGGGFRRLTQLLQWISLTFKAKERGPLSIRTARSTGESFRT